jgi:homoserine kinase
VRAPASSANLGPGFDVLGMALDVHADVGLGEPPADARAVPPSHPVYAAFSALGGRGAIWLRTSIPMARGLGFSGAVRVAAAGLGVLCADGPSAVAERRDDIRSVATELEGHGDNAAASTHGGVVAVVDSTVLALRVGPRLLRSVVVAWVPEATTSTDRSRRALPTTVERSAAVHNLARIVQLTVAVERDDPALLVGATDDLLHQPDRVGGVAGAAAALRAGVDQGAWCGWLSGSGPTVAFLCPPEHADRVVAALPPVGHAKLLRIDPDGVRLLVDDGC